MAFCGLTKQREPEYLPHLSAGPPGGSFGAPELPVPEGAL